MGLPQEYSLLFNALTDLIGQLESITANLKVLQAHSEELYLAKTDWVVSSEKLVQFPAKTRDNTAVPLPIKKEAK